MEVCAAHLAPRLDIFLFVFVFFVGEKKHSSFDAFAKISCSSQLLVLPPVLLSWHRSLASTPPPAASHDLWPHSHCAIPGLFFFFFFDCIYTNIAAKTKNDDLATAVSMRNAFFFLSRLATPNSDEFPGTTMHALYLHVASFTNIASLAPHIHPRTLNRVLDSLSTICWAIQASFNQQRPKMERQ